jgi:adenylate kinase family enzyme
MKISVIGLPGSGKTLFAQRVSEKFSIPHIHLDRFWFEAGGMKIDAKKPGPELENLRASVREKVIEATNTASWVSDGIYAQVQPYIANLADRVIFLDIPLTQRLLNHAVRVFSPSKRHKELNFLHEITFFAEILRRERTSKPKLMKIVEEFNDKIIRLKSRKEIDEYLNNLIK